MSGSLIHNRVETLEASAWQRCPGRARERAARRDQSGQTDFEALSSLPFGARLEGPANVPPTELKAWERAKGQEETQSGSHAAPPPQQLPLAAYGEALGSLCPAMGGGHPVPMPRRARTGHLGRSSATHTPEGWDSPMALSILPSTWLLGMAFPDS